MSFAFSEQISFQHLDDPSNYASNQINLEMKRGSMQGSNQSYRTHLVSDLWKLRDQVSVPAERIAPGESPVETDLRGIPSVQNLLRIADRQVQHSYHLSGPDYYPRSRPQSHPVLIADPIHKQLSRNPQPIDSPVSRNSQEGPHLVTQQSGPPVSPSRSGSAWRVEIPYQDAPTVTAQVEEARNSFDSRRIPFDRAPEIVEEDRGNFVPPKCRTREYTRPQVSCGLGNGQNRVSPGMDPAFIVPKSRAIMEYCIDCPPFGKCRSCHARAGRHESFSEPSKEQEKEVAMAHLSHRKGRSPRGHALPSAPKVEATPSPTFALVPNRQREHTSPDHSPVPSLGTKPIINRNTAHIRKPRAPKVSPSRAPFQCRICFKVLCRKSYISSHMAMHTGVRSYICPIDNCGRNFRWPSNLAR